MYPVINKAISSDGEHVRESRAYFSPQKYRPGIIYHLDYISFDSNLAWLLRSRRKKSRDKCDPTEFVIELRDSRRTCVIEVHAMIVRRYSRWYSEEVEIMIHERELKETIADLSTCMSSVHLNV